MKIAVRDLLVWAIGVAFAMTGMVGVQAVAPPSATSFAPSALVVGGPRQMEKLGRGVVAIHQGGGKAFVSWRLLGTDPDAILQLR